jgi:hypothetical protein
MDDELPFFAEIQVINASILNGNLRDRHGAIIGKSREEGTEKLFYTVMIFDIDEAVVLSQDDVRPTGRTLPRNAIYSGESQRVKVDPKTGEGKLTD